MEKQVLKAAKEAEIWQPAPSLGSPTKTSSYTENLVQSHTRLQSPQELCLVDLVSYVFLVSTFPLTSAVSPYSLGFTGLQGGGLIQTSNLNSLCIMSALCPCPHSHLLPKEASLMKNGHLLMSKRLGHRGEDSRHQLDFSIFNEWKNVVFSIGASLSIFREQCFVLVSAWVG